jgi:hypothetical protein
VFFSYGDVMSSQLADLFAIHPDVFRMKATFANGDDLRISLGGCSAHALGKLSPKRVTGCKKGKRCPTTHVKHIVSLCKAQPYEMIYITDNQQFDWVPVVCKLSQSDESLRIVHLVANPFDVIYNHVMHRLSLIGQDVLNNEDTEAVLGDTKILCDRIRSDLSSLNKTACNRNRVKSFSVKTLVRTFPESWLELHNFLGTYVDDRTQDLLDEESVAEGLKSQIQAVRKARKHMFSSTLIKNLVDICGRIKI